MITTINHSKLPQQKLTLTHILTDSAETIKLLEKECNYQKPWSLEDKQARPEKNKQIPEKAYNKIDFFL